MKKIIMFVLVFLLLLGFFSQSVASTQQNSYNESLNYLSDQPEEDDTEQSSFTEQMIKELLRLRFQLGSIQGVGKYFYNQFRPPVAFQPFPNSVIVDYNEQKYFEIAAKNPDTGEYQKLITLANTYAWGWMNKKVAFSFEVVKEDNSSLDLWNIQFEPKTLEMFPNRDNLNWPGADLPLKTNVSIMLKSNDVDPSVFTQDIVLKVNIIREEALDKFGILRGVPDYVMDNREEYLKKQEELGAPPFFTSAFLYYYYKIPIPFVGGAGTLWWINREYPLYEKSVDSTVEILIKVNKYHLAVLEPPGEVNIEPYEVKSIPINIKNLGSHIDTYNFEVKSSNKDIMVTPPPSITLEPGEEAQAFVGVAAPKKFYSLDEITSISVEAYSVQDEDNVFSNTIVLKTSGVYATGGPTINLSLIIVTIFIIFLVGFYIFKRYRGKGKNIKDLKEWFSNFSKFFDRFKKEKTEKEEIESEEVVEEECLEEPQEEYIEEEIAEEYKKESVDEDLIDKEKPVEKETQIIEQVEEEPVEFQEDETQGIDTVDDQDIAQQQEVEKESETLEQLPPVEESDEELAKKQRKQEKLRKKQEALQRALNEQEKQKRKMKFKK